MKYKSMLIYLSMLVALVIMALIGCKKKSSENAGFSTMDVRMTDASGLYEKVVVDIREVLVHVEGSGWAKVNISRAGAYNLLDFNNGKDTLLAHGSILAGHVTQIRLVLGTNNYLVLNGVTILMEAPSAEESGLKININQTCEAGKNYVIWLDFNANKSVVLKGNGGYALKPVIRGFLADNSGSVSGDINPDLAANYVYAIPVGNINDTFATYSRSDGYFKICGLVAGSYYLTFSNNTSVVKVINPVYITANAETNLGTVNIP
ncbi:MAG: DUF4382 domain-containing protein [Bacteroidota bacterium]|nr:DUF4382 domain-containing protein [Bacteroidota bacterium]